MNDYRNYPSTTCFDPPEEGMLPGETIVWTRRAGTGMCVLCIGLSVIIVGPIILFEFTEELGFSDLEIVSGLALIVLTIMFVIISLVRTRRTRYYLTSERLIVVRSGNIINEIPLHHFAGKPLKQFLETRVTHTTNNRPVYQIRIYDPITDESIEFKGQSEDSVEVFEQIGNMRECPYCNFDNTALSSKCRNCGAVL